MINDVGLYLSPPGVVLMTPRGWGRWNSAATEAPGNKGACHRDEGWVESPRPQPVDARRQPGALARGCGRQPEETSPGSDRRLPVARSRSGGAPRRVDRDTGQYAIRRKDPANRIVECHRRAHRARPENRTDRFGPEPIQFR